jgi:hypothetical protein
MWTSEFFHHSSRISRALGGLLAGQNKTEEAYAVELENLRVAGLVVPAAQVG